ncbi:MAG: membrane peptidoglycan carboxypeptidase, partial [Myxococcota bacterium]
MLQACGIVTFSTGDPIELVREPQTSRVLASDGTVIAELHGVENRQDVTLAEISPMLQAAVIAIEDRRFYTHGGVDIPAIGRALVANIEAGAIEQGGSTITQQYVKNTITGSAVTAERKVEEAALAM